MASNEFIKDDLNSASQEVVPGPNVCKILDLVNSDFGIKINFGGMYACRRFSCVLSM
jgi:hypothetical protein